MHRILTKSECLCVCTLKQEIFGLFVFAKLLGIIFVIRHLIVVFFPHSTVSSSSSSSNNKWTGTARKTRRRRRKRRRQSGMKRKMTLKTRKMEWSELPLILKKKKRSQNYPSKLLALGALNLRAHWQLKEKMELSGWTHTAGVIFLTWSFSPSRNFSNCSMSGCRKWSWGNFWLLGVDLEMQSFCNPWALSPSPPARLSTYSNFELPFALPSRAAVFLFTFIPLQIAQSLIFKTLCLFC